MSYTIFCELVSRWVKGRDFEAVAVLLDWVEENGQARELTSVSRINAAWGEYLNMMVQYA